ncbi:MAG TPA: immunoglobulin-like domain-containing protein [Solirubrobacterales bacterium]|nr:immunoglobulin-like domain-containing protein [Solirubrobacterales bacterium]
MASLAALALMIGGSSEEARAFVREDSSALGSPSFCKSGDLAHDFGLSQLPPVREPPEGGDLPFGPKTVRLLGDWGKILPVGQSFGYGLWSENYYGRTPLKWTLRARMFAVSSAGETGREVDRSQLKVKTISSRDEIELYLDPLRRPGFYRYDFEILDEDGKQLANYGEHLKVFARRYWKPRLTLNGSEFRPGQRVLSRVENHGTEQVNYGEEFGVQRLEGGSWVAVPGMTQRVWALWLGLAGPGVSGRCSSLHLPDDVAPGDYRIVKRVGKASWPRGRSYWLAARFAVVG